MLRKFIRLSSTERRLLFQAFGTVVWTRMGLWLLPVDSLRRLLRLRAIPSVSPGYRVERLVWAVQAASRRVPYATCLTQSLSLQYLMDRYGHESTVQIGVSKSAAGLFEAHAWVEWNGRVLLNTPAEIAPYTRLLKWGDFAK